MKAWGDTVPPTTQTERRLYNVAYRTVTIIGLGTLGGFVADSLASLEGIEKLIIVDHDVVENKNLKNSIYRPIDIDLLKVDALEDIITSRISGIEISKHAMRFDEWTSTIPKSDLVLDCRDFTYDRGRFIDARLYVSSRYLIVDCRKNVKYKERKEGRYLEELTRDDLKYASTMVSMLLHSNTINSLIEAASVQKYELDYVKRIDNCSYDILYDDAPGNDKFINLPEKILPILDLNKKRDLNLYVGSKAFPIAKSVIPRSTLKSGNDLIVNLASLTNLQCDFNHYVVSLFNEGGQVFIELIPETGAA